MLATLPVSLNSSHLWGKQLKEQGRGFRADSGTVAYSVLMTLMGVAGLVMKPRWQGLYGEYIWAYGGNVSVSFAVYFIVSLAPYARQFGRLVIGGSAFLVVEAFELTDGFGVMSNVYDPGDLVANALGVGLAVTADAAAGLVRERHSRKG